MKFARAFRMALLLMGCQVCLAQADIYKPALPDTVIAPPKLSFPVTQLYAPSGLLTLGLALNNNGPSSLNTRIVNLRNDHLPNFATNVDDYFQYAPIAAVYAMDAIGLKSKNGFLTKSAALLNGELLMLGLVFGGKSMFHSERPDGRSHNSFPSGHTAQAFAAAAFLSEEYGGTFKYVPYVAYSGAACVGAFRMANNRHYLSDVLAGAGIGILCVKSAYWVNKFLWPKKYRQRP